MKKLTENWLRNLLPCADGLAFAKSCKFNFHKIYDTCDRGDWLIWLLRKSGKLNKPKAVKIAIACAEHVIEIYEKKYPKDKRPRLAIEAAQKWLKTPTEKNRAAVAAADADAAYAAADAAVAAAYAAADAAVAAVAAADAAVAAADADVAAADAAVAAAYAAVAAAVAAADAAVAAAADARLKERKWQADKIREILPNPF